MNQLYFPNDTSDNILFAIGKAMASRKLEAFLKEGRKNCHFVCLLVKKIEKSRLVLLHVEKNVLEK